MGLLMGAPVMQNILSKIAFNVSAMLLDERNQELNFEKNVIIFEFCVHLFSNYYYYMLFVNLSHIQIKTGKNF